MFVVLSTLSLVHFSVNAKPLAFDLFVKDSFEDLIKFWTVSPEKNARGHTVIQPKGLQDSLKVHTWAPG